MKSSARILARRNCLTRSLRRCYDANIIMRLPDSIPVRSSLLLVLAVSIALALTTDVYAAGESIGTLQIAEGSYVSYSASENPAVPPGSWIRLRFGSQNPDGSIPIIVRPDDLSIAPIEVPQGALIYSLAAAASGTLRYVAGRREIELFVTLIARLRESPDAPPLQYELRFTTGTAEAVNTAETQSVEVDGMPVGQSNQIRLVGAATNRPDALPGPGDAVYAVLSGSFDWLPSP